MTTSHQTTTGFAELNGTKFYYELAGEGHLLVLLHAGIADSRMWDDQFFVFARHFQVLRYDLRGYGKTAIVDAPYSHHQDLFDLLNRLGIAQAHLLGCSMGGTTIIDFALVHPDRVTSLLPVACTPSGYEAVKEPPPHLEDMIAKFEQGDFEGVAELEVQLWVDGPQRRPDQVDSTVRNRVRAMDMIALQNEALGLGEVQALNPSAATRLSEVHAPTLIINGELDRSIMRNAGEFLAANISGSKQTVIPGSAHLPNMERPALFNQIVLDFLKQL